MKNSILFICLSLVLFSCGSSSNSSEYPKRSFEHLEAIFYSLYGNFIIEEGDGSFLVMPDDNLTGDVSDFIATLNSKLIKSGFNQSDICISICVTIDDPRFPSVPCEEYMYVKISTGKIYTCSSKGLHRYYGDIDF